MTQQQVYVPHIYGKRMLGIQKIWSQPQHIILKATNCGFKKGRFPIGIDGEATAHLLDNTPIPVKTLIDSGVSRPILNKHFYDTHPFLHTYPKYKITPRSVVIGNDTVLPCNEAIAIMVEFSCHVFHVILYLLECSKDYGLYTDQKAMYELEGGADFRNLPFHFLMRSLNLYAGETVKIKPGQLK